MTHSIAKNINRGIKEKLAMAIYHPVDLYSTRNLPWAVLSKVRLAINFEMFNALENEVSWGVYWKLTEGVPFGEMKL